MTRQNGSNPFLIYPETHARGREYFTTTARDSSRAKLLHANALEFLIPPVSHFLLVFFLFFLFFFFFFYLYPYERVFDRDLFGRRAAKMGIWLLHKPALRSSNIFLPPLSLFFLSSTRCARYARSIVSKERRTSRHYQISGNLRRNANDSGS